MAEWPRIPQLSARTNAMNSLYLFSQLAWTLLPSDFHVLVCGRNVSDGSCKLQQLNIYIILMQVWDLSASRLTFPSSLPPSALPGYSYSLSILDLACNVSSTHVSLLSENSMTDDEWGSAQKKQKQMENESRTGDRPTPFCLVSLDDAFTGPEAETRNAKRTGHPIKDGLKRDRGGRREMRKKGNEGESGMPKEVKKRRCEGCQEKQDNERQRMTSEGTDVPTFTDLRLRTAYPSRRWPTLIGVGRRWSSISAEAKPAHLHRSSPTAVCLPWPTLVDLGPGWWRSKLGRQFA
ncbi:hypothetical protein B0H13DRAFT_1868902 [Mycena leptocephala]|nr:hypothetical protein B0H13DRAFT_1868902 [Mycena leptocephala]